MLYTIPDALSLKSYTTSKKKNGMQDDSAHKDQRHARNRGHYRNRYKDCETLGEKKKTCKYVVNKGEKKKKKK
jgi:hypothetical protein